MKMIYSKQLQEAIEEFNKLPPVNYRHDNVISKIFTWMKKIERDLKENGR